MQSQLQHLPQAQVYRDKAPGVFPCLLSLNGESQGHHPVLVRSPVSDRGANYVRQSKPQDSLKPRLETEGAGNTPYSPSLILSLSLVSLCILKGGKVSRQGKGEPMSSSYSPSDSRPQAGQPQH
jgi:hypothetical protein